MESKYFRSLLKFALVPLVFTFAVFASLKPVHDGFTGAGEMMAQGILTTLAFIFIVCFQLISHFSGYGWAIAFAAVVAIFPAHLKIESDCRGSARVRALATQDLREFDESCFDESQRLEGRGSLMESHFYDDEKFRQFLDRNGRFPERKCLELHRSVVHFDLARVSQLIDAGARPDCSLGSPRMESLVSRFTSAFGHRAFGFQSAIESRKSSLEERQKAEQELNDLKERRQELARVLGIEM